MRVHRGLYRSRVAFVVLLLLAGTGHAWAATAGSATAVDRGASLFLGQSRFENGGPPCGACHRLSSLGFPNGGTLGPDLSPAYQTLGPDGTDVTLKTLFFPTMMPLYEKRPLSGAEQEALKALLRQAPPVAQGAGHTGVVAGIAGGGFVVLIALAWVGWRHRLLGVRAPLLRGARAGHGGVQP